MKFINENTVEGEMSETDFARKIAEEALRRKDIARYGRDGNIEVYSENRSYRGIPYIIKIIRYYQVGILIKQIKGMNHLGKWAVLEYPSEIREAVQALNNLSEWGGEFLFADTLHYWNRDQTLFQMVEEMDKRARDDIDGIPKAIDDFRKKTADKLNAVEKLWADFLPSRRGGEKL